MTTPDDEWIGVNDLARELGLPVRTIYAWRAKRQGPRAATFGKHLRFRRSDVDSWIERQMDDKQPTDDDREQVSA